MIDIKEATIEQLMAELATREGIDYRKVEIGEDLQLYARSWRGYYYPTRIIVWNLKGGW